MDNLQVITRGKSGPKIGDFSIKNPFLEHQKSPMTMFKNLSVPFGLVYLQRQSGDLNRSISPSDPTSVLRDFQSINVDSALRGVDHHTQHHAEEVEVISKSLYDKLLGVVDEIKSQRNRSKTRKIHRPHHAKSPHHKHHSSHHRKKTRKL